jgi:DNA-directed RNA polymerase specialized sigma24 family protein
MNSDAELLGRYAREGSEEAFDELVKRHVDLVYSAALRCLNGDVHRAEDVTQEVFAEMARKSAALMRHPTLVGWLYVAARQMSSHAVRGGAPTHGA